MAEIEIRIVAEHRQRLLLELGRVAIKHHHTLLRQRVVRDPQGVCLTIKLRGPADSQLPLEEAIAEHPRVLSLESLHGPQEMWGPVSPHIAAAPPQNSSQSVSNSAHKQSEADRDVVERLLPSLAKDYPHIIPWLMHLGHSVSPDQRAASLHMAGRRTGVWVYKRDFAMGSRLSLINAIRRVLLPAMRDLVHVEFNRTQLHIADSPLCRQGEVSGCDFFRGFADGLIEDAVETGPGFVRVARCRSNGAPECALEVSR